MKTTSIILHTDLNWTTTGNLAQCINLIIGPTDYVA